MKTSLKTFPKPTFKGKRIPYRTEVEQWKEALTEELKEIIKYEEDANRPFRAAIYLAKEILGQ